MTTQRPEFELIDWIRARVNDRPPVTVGIGDDAACLESCDRESLVTTDMLMEGVDFEFETATPQLAGRKAMAANLSDIAAMAGRPTAAFVSLALPQQRGSAFARDVQRGLLDLADEFDVVVAGGDTNSWNGPLVINVTVIGQPLGLHPVYRTGAQIGDWIFVTGSLGGSLPSGRHLTFTPRLREVEQLAALAELHSMIDISDGLAADLHHILKASQVGAILWEQKIPLSPAASLDKQKSPLLHALSDGEDFELLFTVTPDAGRRLQLDWHHPTPLTRIGIIVADSGCWLEAADGTRTVLPPMGWTHGLDDSSESLSGPR